jgi:imidazolonepropionase-like amidohydrolase
VIPGLINAHAHVDSTTLEGPSPTNQLAQYAHYGVTTLLSLGEGRMDALNARDTSWTAHPPSARVMAAGRIYTPMTPEDARAVVDTLAGQNVDYVKIRVDDFLDTQPIMPPEAYQAVIEAAHSHNLPVAVHFVDLEVGKGVLRAGADLLAHSVRDLPVDQEFIDLMKQRNTCLIPTLTRELSTFYLAERPAMFDDPFFLEKAAPPNLDTYITPAIQTAQTSPAAEYYKSHLPVAEENLRTLNTAGVPIAFGTDTGIGFPGRFQGYLEHEELRMLVEAGMTPEEAIRSATSVTARCIGREGQVGSLVPGAWADMVVLNANPLEDIMNTRQIDAVYIGGTRFR